MPGESTLERLFVPLNSRFYEAFADETKSWELRGVNDQFNPETVTVGRTVELRRGYATDDSLWGTITDVKTFPRLSAIPTAIDHHDIAPNTSRAEFLDSAAALLGQYDQYIAFHVDITNPSSDTRLAADGGLSIGTFEDLQGRRPQPIDRNPSIDCNGCAASFNWQDYWKPRYVDDDGNRTEDPHEASFLCDDCYAEREQQARRRANNYQLTNWPTGELVGGREDSQ